MEILCSVWKSEVKLSHPYMIRDNQFRRFFSNPINQRLYVRTRQQRDDTRIHHSQPLHAIHPQLRINNTTIPLWKQRSSTNWVVYTQSIGQNKILPVIIGLHNLARLVLFGQHILQRTSEGVLIARDGGQSVQLRTGLALQPGSYSSVHTSFSGAVDAIVRKNLARLYAASRSYE